MAKKALITGITGQDGAYLSRLLLDKGYSVLGLANDEFTGNLEYLGAADEVEMHVGDLADREFIRNMVQRGFDEVYHLGGMTSPGESWKLVDKVTNTNVQGAVNILQSIHELSPKARLFNAATSEMFGRNHSEGAQTEETPMNPTNPYAVTKIYSYFLTNVYRESYGLYFTNGILFNHESPLRGVNFVTRKISDAVARIKLGKADTIVLGNIDSTRDWGFAGDYVEAMWLMLQQDEPDNFVISTGEYHSIRDFLDLAFNHIGVQDWEPHVKIDKALYRPIELVSLYGHSQKAKETLGWSPRTRFKDLVAMMVDADIKRYGG